MRRQKILQLSLLLLFGWMRPASAQMPGPVGDLLKKIRENNGTGMAYDYEIRMIRLSDGSTTDSVRGHLCNAPNHYRDSNSVFFTARSGDYYCKLNYAQKTATVYNVKLVAQQMKVSLNAVPSNIYGITNDMLETDAVLTVDTSNRQLYRMLYRFRGQQLRSLQLDLKRSDYTLVAALFEANETEGPEDKDPYVRSYRIWNVRKHEDAELPDLSGIFRIEQGKVKMHQKYADYTLNELVR